MKISNTKEDLGLVQRAKAGEYQAFDLLVLKYQSRLISTAFSYVKDMPTAEDMVQESFIKSFKSLNSFREDSSFYTWVYRITVNTCKNFLVSKKRKDELLQTDVSETKIQAIEPEETDTPEGIFGALQLQEIVQRAISDLSEETKTALTLRELDGLSYEQIAEIIQCPVGTVRSRIFRAREVLDTVIQDFKTSSKYSKKENKNER